MNDLEKFRKVQVSEEFDVKIWQVSEEFDVKIWQVSDKWVVDVVDCKMVNCENDVKTESYNLSHETSCSTLLQVVPLDERPAKC